MAPSNHPWSVTRRQAHKQEWCDAQVVSASLSQRTLAQCTSGFSHLVVRNQDLMLLLPLDRPSRVLLEVFLIHHLALAVRGRRDAPLDDTSARASLLG